MQAIYRGGQGSRVVFTHPRQAAHPIRRLSLAVLKWCNKHPIHTNSKQTVPKTENLRAVWKGFRFRVRVHILQEYPIYYRSIRYKKHPEPSMVCMFTGDIGFRPNSIHYKYRSQKKVWCVNTEGYAWLWGTSWGMITAPRKWWHHHAHWFRVAPDFANYDGILTWWGHPMGLAYSNEHYVRSKSTYIWYRVQGTRAAIEIRGIPFFGRNIF